MEKLNLGYSLKNIPIPTENNYLKLLIARTEQFIQKMRWRAFFYLNPDLKQEVKETFGFKSSRTAPQVKELTPFENDLLQVISKVKFSKHRTEFQQKLQKDIKRINKSKHVLVPADKTTNIYEVPTDQYKKLLFENITKDYKKTTNQSIRDVNLEAKTIAHTLEIDDRTEVYCQKPAYITLKDHKENFANSPKCRLINPAKSDIGKISKIKLQKINDTIRESSSLQQWQSTKQAIDWFTSLENKDSLQFLQLDICEFYPSISESLLDKAIKHASLYTHIDRDTTHIIKHSRKSFLFSKIDTSSNAPTNTELDTWTKKEGAFDVTMGAPDGAEVCELVGLFLLNEVERKFPQLNFGLYRDDGLAVHKHIPGPKLNKLRKDITRLFKSHGLNITLETCMKRVNFLDVKLDLDNSSYSPYRKPNDVPLYIHKHSNHPHTVLKQLPITINKRLAEISSEKAAFDAEKEEYQKALLNSGYKHILEYNQESEPQEAHNKKKKSRQRNITWYNPPFCSAVTTNIGRQFLNLIDIHFPKKHKLHKIFNRNQVKIGYSCTKNMKAIIQSHNNKVLNNNDSTQKEGEQACNCRKKDKCPVDNKCQQDDVIYHATVTNHSKNEVKQYIGSTTNFKTRYTGHKSSFKNEKNRNATTLSNYIWDNKLDGETNIQWKILCKATSYANGQKFCDLCLTEKLHIAKNTNDSSYLNKRSELAQKCRHRAKFKLANYK